MKQGSGWRLGWDPEASKFSGLVGSDRWSLELTQAELEAFCRLALELAETMTAMAAEVMPEERLCCEIASPEVWLEAEGFPHSYELHLILQEQRGGEGYWDAAAVPELLQAVRQLGVF
ncbi:MAG: DUF1818 family protein [Elainellaceae cyanobacterium]